MTRNISDIGWQPLLKDLGLAASRVLRKAGLPDDLLSRSGDGLTTDEYFRFWRALEAEAGDAMFPLRIVETVSAESFAPPLFAALCSANLMQAVQRPAKYKQLVAPMKLDVNVGQAGELTVSPRWQSVQIDVPYSLQVAEIAFFLRLARLATREPVKALRVEISRLPPSAYTRRYESFFGVRVQHGESPSITFTAADALRPFLTINEGMWRVFEPDLRRRLSELDATATIAERVHAVLLELLPGNAATIEKTAERRHEQAHATASPEDEGESFRASVNSTRRTWLATTLAIPRCPLARSLFSSALKIPIPSIAHSRLDGADARQCSARHAPELSRDTPLLPVRKAGADHRMAGTGCKCVDAAPSLRSWCPHS